MCKIVIQSREALKEISGAQSKRTLSKILGEETEDFNEIIMLLKEADKKLSDMNNTEKESILKGIWEYQAIDILNDTKGNLNNTLDIFIKDIYKDSFHFFLELIQNADDASKEGSEHGLSIIIDKDKNIIFEYDERGFNFSDIFAITSLGNSTKKAQLEDNADIGEKGIGFKSIFAIVKKIEIKSKYFSFDIEHKDKRSSILEPAKITLETSEKTSLKLMLNEEAKTEKNLQEIHNWMKNNVECDSWDNPFLFLKNITKVSYRNELYSYITESKNKKKEVIDDKLCLVQVHNRQYIVYTEKMIFDKLAVECRWEHLKEQLKVYDNYEMKRPVQIAFPINIEVETYGKIYSYLPTNIKLNFPVFINLDVHLTASRGNISELDFAGGSLWNEQVKENLPQFLVNAYEYIISKYDDEKVEQGDILKDLCKSFYKYIPIKQQSGIYEEALNKFKNMIIEKKIILTNENNFEMKADVRGLSSNPYRYDCSNVDLIESIYKFNGMNTMDEVFPKDSRWNKFAKDIDTQNYYAIYDFIEKQGGIKKYWHGDSIDKKQILEQVINQLNEDCPTLSNRNTIREVEIIPVEKDEYFELYAYNQIENVLFLHSQDQKIEDKKNSSYIYEGSLKIQGLKELVSRIFGINKYDLKDYFRRQVKELGNQITFEKMNEFIYNTFRFYYNASDSFSKDDISVTIKEFMGKYTFSINDWKLYTGKKVNQAYIEKIIKTGKIILEIWAIPEEIQDEAKLKYIEYLMFLGIKHRVEFSEGKLDIKSTDLIEYNDWCKPILEATGKYKFDNAIQEYLLMNINECALDIDINILRSFAQKLGLFVYDEDNKYKFNKREIFIIEDDIISALTKKFEEMKGGAGQLSDSIYTIISYNCYNNIWEKLSRDSALLVSKNWNNRKKDEKLVQHYFQQSSYWRVSNWLITLKRTKLLNSFFKNEYAWGWDGDSKPHQLDLQNFLACHKELEKDGLGNLMKKGYCISTSLETASNYFGNSDIEEFIDGINFNVREISSNIDQFKLSEISVHSSMGADDIIIFDKENNKTENITRLILKQRDRSTTLFKAYESYGINLPVYIKKEIQDYFGDLKTQPSKITTLLTAGSDKYCADVFFDFHVENISKAKEELVSIWNKTILDQLCNSFQLIDGKQMQGYEYTCPICGEKSLSALSGMRFGRFKHVGLGSQYLYIVACLNCYNTLNYSKSIMINDLARIIKEFESCYCADDKHIKNHSVMHTVDLEVETWDGENKKLRMKISYLNMVLYLNDQYRL